MTHQLLFHNGFNARSWLGNTLVLSHVVTKCEWEVLNDLSSDHIPVLTYRNVDSQWKNIPIIKPKWNLTKADWNLFSKLCNGIKLENYKSNTIDLYNDNLINKILNIANKTFPIPAMTNRKMSVPRFPLI